MRTQVSGHRKLAISIGAGLLMIVTGCTQSGDGLNKSATDPKTEIASKEGKLREGENTELVKDESGARIIREKSSLSKKGTNIAVLVNRAPITNYDIKRRASFLKLRRIGGNRTKKATEELIEEQLKMQEAKKSGSTASDSVVNQAFADFAKRNKMSSKNMSGVLNKAGVTAKHFKEFLRVQISWQRTVGRKFQGGARKLSQSDALFSLRKSGEAKPETREFKLQQIIFVVPHAKRKKLLKPRTAEAKAFSQRFTNCTDTLSQIKTLRDVAMKDLGRVLEPELPTTWKDEITKTDAGKTTRTKVTAKGVEFIAVCSVRNVSDDKAAQLVSQSKKFDTLNSKGNKVSEDYLKELRSKATIIYR